MKITIYKYSLVLLCIFMLPMTYVNAEVTKYKNRISVGGYFISKYDSEIGVSDKDAGVGVVINPRTALGMKNEQSVFRLDGLFRFNDHHSLMYSWYSVKSTGTRTIDTEIPWDPPIPVGANIESSLETDLFKVGYLWSFYNEDQVELGVGLGLHITQLRVELNAESTGTPYTTENVDTTVPLPVIMFKLGYKITPKLKMSYISQIFAIELEGITGSYSDQTLGVEYQFWKHVGLGVGLNGSNLSIEQEEGNRRINYNNRISGAILFITGNF